MNVGVPRIDPTLDAWMLSRYADVSAALREPGLVAGNAATIDQAGHAEFREAAKRALSSDRVEEWLEAVAPVASRIHGGLDLSEPVDLVDAFAEPWALEVAVAVTGANPDEAERLSGLARAIFLGAAEPSDEGLQAGSAMATTELATTFSNPFVLQTFVALSQTLPCFLANSWLALLRHPAEVRLLRAEPELVPNAVEELLRYGGPSLAVFRRALRAVTINGTQIGAGERVILMLAEANRDPEEFADPDRLDVRRSAPNHVALGGGGHGCVGAALVRVFAGVGMRAFLEYFSSARLSGSISLRGGFAIRWPGSLRVRV